MRENAPNANKFGDLYVAFRLFEQWLRIGALDDDDGDDDEIDETDDDISNIDDDERESEFGNDASELDISLIASSLLVGGPPKREQQVDVSDVESTDAV